MLVSVELHGIMRRFTPPDAAGDTASLTVPEGATLGDVLERLKMTAHSYHLKAQIKVNGAAVKDLTTRLQGGDQVQIYGPLIGGG